MNLLDISNISETDIARNIKDMVDTLIAVLPDGRIQSVSENTCQMLEYEREEIIGKPIDQIIVLEDIIFKEEWIEYLIETKRIKNIEMSYLTKRKTTIPVSLSISSIQDNKDQCKGLLFMARNITALKSLEYELNKAVKYTQGLIHSSMDMIVSTDINGLITEFNKTAQKRYGYSFEEMLGRDINTLFNNPADAKRIEEEVKKSNKFNSEFFGIDREKNVFPIMVSASALHNKDGKSEGFMEIIRDMTEIKQADKCIRFLKRAVQTMQIGVTITDLDGYILYSNAADSEMHGYSEIELIGKHAKIFAPKELSAPMSLEKKKELDSMKIWKRESINVRKNGTTFPVQLMSDLVYDENDEPFAIVTTCEDITDRKNMERELLQHRNHLEELVEKRTKELENRNEDLTKAKEAAEAGDRAKSDFLALVSHELRTPLTSLRGFTHLIKEELENTLVPILKDESKKSEKGIRNIREGLEIMKSESERLSYMINNVLDIAKIEAGKIEWKAEPVDMVQLFEATLASMMVLFNEKGLDIKNEVTLNGVQAIGDRDRLIQVVTNLFSNAIKFTDQGEITYRIIEEDELIRCEVEDSGSGIPENMLETIFEKFHQVGDVLVDKPQGTGLGLPICKEIIEHHNGRIWAENNEGKGSKFIFTLPATTALFHDHSLLL